MSLKTISKAKCDLYASGIPIRMSEYRDFRHFISALSNGSIDGYDQLAFVISHETIIYNFWESPYIVTNAVLYDWIQSNPLPTTIEEEVELALGDDYSLEQFLKRNGKVSKEQYLNLRKKRQSLSEKSKIPTSIIHTYKPEKQNTSEKQNKVPENIEPSYHQYSSDRNSTDSTLGRKSSQNNLTAQKKAAIWTVVTHNPVLGYVLGHQKPKEDDKPDK